MFGPGSARFHFSLAWRGRAGDLARGGGAGGGRGRRRDGSGPRDQRARTREISLNIQSRIRSVFWWEDKAGFYRRVIQWTENDPEYCNAMRSSYREPRDRVNINAAVSSDILRIISFLRRETVGLIIFREFFGDEGIGCNQLLRVIGEDEIILTCDWYALCV